MTLLRWMLRWLSVSITVDDEYPVWIRMPADRPVFHTDPAETRRALYPPPMWRTCQRCGVQYARSEESENVAVPVCQECLGAPESVLEFRPRHHTDRGEVA